MLLNIVCYRSGAKGCELRQLQTVLASRFKSRDGFLRACNRNPQLISTDRRLFHELRRLYEQEMCDFWRRHFSLKTLRGLRVLSVGFQLSAFSVIKRVLTPAVLASEPTFYRPIR